MKFSLIYLQLKSKWCQTGFFGEFESFDYFYFKKFKFKF